MTPVSIDILTIFPEMFAGPFGSGMIKRAVEATRVAVRLHNIRDFATDKHRSVDDIPYGGGAGMVMRPEPLVAAIESVPRVGNGIRILLSPQGEPFRQAMAAELAQHDQLVLVCGRYEGVDERVHEGWIDRELSIGDYVLTGGEFAAMVVVDAVVRLIPGVVGNAASIVDESHAAGLLEYPQYTRPPEFRGRAVPAVLQSGNHQEIARWRRERALERTWWRRPELLASASLTAEDKVFLQSLQAQRTEE